MSSFHHRDTEGTEDEIVLVCGEVPANQKPLASPRESISLLSHMSRSVSRLFSNRYLPIGEKTLSSSCYFSVASASLR